MPAVRGQLVAYCSESKEGTLTLVNLTSDEPRRLTNVPRSGRILKHPNLDVIIAFGHVQNLDDTRLSGRAGILADIFVYDFSHDHGSEKTPFVKHDKSIRVYALIGIERESYSMYKP